MKYFIVTHTIRDGEYEYMYQTPVMAESRDMAELKIRREDSQWIEDDYRQAEINSISELSKKEFDVIKKYIY